MKNVKQILSILVPAFLLACIVSCASSIPSKRLSKDAPLCVFVDSSDVLYSQVIVGEAGVDGVSRRIAKYLDRRLDERGIKTAPGESFKSGDPKIIIKLDTIETVASTSIGMWAPIVKQQPKIKFEAILMSGDGSTLFRTEDQKDDESLDTAAKKVGEAVADRVSRYY